MFKKITFIILTLTSFISCSRTNIIEDVVEHHADGEKKVVHYYEVKKDGSKTWVRETWFYKEGMKHLDGTISNDKRNGCFTTYYKSGDVMSVGEFVDGKREGKATTYHENGKIKYEGFYVNGKECGIWKFYDENGNLYNELNRDIQ